MLFNIAWKNIWRNKARSLVVILSVMLGLWVGAFILSYVFGMIDQRLEDAIGSEISHLQMHHPEFKTDFDPKFYLAQGGELSQKLESDPRVLGISARVLVNGMVASPSSSAGGKFIGVNPLKEDNLTGLSESIMEGEFLSKDDRNKVVIGKKLAEKLKVRVRSKIVLTFQDTEGNIVAGAFRIKGIFKSYNSALELNNLYVNSYDLSRLLNADGMVHEIALLLANPEEVETFVTELSTKYPSVLSESWRQLSPELRLMIDSLDQYMIIFFVIILLALSFGIVNTMLMAVLERVREIGMLMAIGMNKRKLFGMIAIETILMVAIAAPPGLLLSYFSIQYLGINGLDLSSIYQEGYAVYGFKPIIYPKLETIYYFRITGLVVITAMLSSVYPALTALKLDPVKAIRKL